MEGFDGLETGKFVSGDRPRTSSRMVCRSPSAYIAGDKAQLIRNANTAETCCFEKNKTKYLRQKDGLIRELILITGVLSP